jgi:hypothetical protein
MKIGLAHSKFEDILALNFLSLFKPFLIRKDVRRKFARCNSRDEHWEDYTLEYLILA